MKGVGVGGLIMQPTGNKPHGGFKRINQTHHRRKLLFFPGSAALQSAVLVFDMGLQFMDFKPLNAASGVVSSSSLPPECGLSGSFGPENPTLVEMTDGPKNIKCSFVVLLLCWVHT